MRTVAAVVALVACVHAGLWALMRDNVRAPNFDGQLASVSYAPFEGSAHPDRRRHGAHARKFVPISNCWRRSRARSAPIPRPAASSSCPASPPNSDCASRPAPGSTRIRIATSVKSARSIDLAKRHSNVNGIIVGNETIYRGEQKVSDLIQMIQRVKRSTNVPVTTGEIWHVWIEHPELVSAVDYIAAHILPYWEGFSETQAVDQAIIDLRQAAPGLSRQAHRHRRVRLAERRLQSQERQSRPHRTGRRAARFRDARRSLWHRLQHRRSHRPAVEDLRRRRRSLLGTCSTPSRHPKFDWTGPITDPDHWRLADDRHPGERAAVAAAPGDERRHVVAGRHAGRRREYCGCLVRRRVRLLERPLFRAGRRLRARPRHRCC